MSKVVRFYQDLLAPVVANRKIILAIGSLTDSAAWVENLRALGARPPFILAESVGAGSVPNWPSIQYRVVGGVGAAHQLAAFRNYRDTLGDLPRDVRVELDDYDPDGSALVIVRAQHQPNSVGNRPVFAPRPYSWRRLEDKLVADEIWHAAEVPHAPSRNVRVDVSALLAATDELDRGQGVVWSGDFREGYNSGADFVRWVRTRNEAVGLVAFFASHCDQVRVMPFLEGLPCSIHGIVFPEDVAVFRPVELVVLRVRGSSRLLYAGNGTFWRPRKTQSETIRRYAQWVGVVLRERVGFRGGFTMDGILTRDGFLPTEINPRTGAALWTVASSVPELPLPLLEMCVRRGLALDYRPRELENLVVAAVDSSPCGGGWSMTPTMLENRTRSLVYRKKGFRYAEVGEHPDAVVETGPSGVGGVVRVCITQDIVESSGSISALVAESFGFLDHEIGTDFGVLDAPDVFKS